MDAKGQISVEFVLLIGLILLIVMGIASFFGEDNELNQAMTVARSGAIDGANMDSFGIYPEDAFNNYTTNHPRLLSQSSVKIIKIDYINHGFNATYNKTKIQLQIIASAPSVTDSGDRKALGERIRFNAMKSICESFGTSDQTNSLYNPAFSNRYVFTAGVRWV